MKTADEGQGRRTLTDIPEDIAKEAERLAGIWRHIPSHNRDEFRRDISQALLSERSRQIERDAKIAEKQAGDFLSPQYATGQPSSSFAERFACEEVARAIRAQEPK